jgi:ribosomal protein S18 acetylase RimI-like enzyme
MEGWVAEPPAVDEKAASRAVRLRPAGPQDEPLLHGLFAEDKAAQLTAAGMAEALVHGLIEMQYRGRAMSYAVLYPQAQDLILLGADGAPAGRLLLDRNRERWRIVDLAVGAAQRGQGMGTQVLRLCQQQAAAVGARLELQVAAGNPARRLYVRLGFQVCGGDDVTVEMSWYGSEPGDA